MPRWDMPISYTSGKHMQKRMSTADGSFFTMLISFPVYLAGFSILIRTSSGSASVLFLNAIFTSIIWAYRPAQTIVEERCFPRSSHMNKIHVVNRRLCRRRTPYLPFFESFVVLVTLCIKYHYSIPGISRQEKIAIYERICYYH